MSLLNNNSLTVNFFLKEYSELKKKIEEKDIEINRLANALRDANVINQNLNQKISLIEKRELGLNFIGYLRSKISNLNCIIDESNSLDLDQICECKRCRFNQINEYLSSAVPKIKEYFLFLFVFLCLWYLGFIFYHAWKTF
jgi:hypothetical protein